MDVFHFVKVTLAIAGKPNHAPFISLLLKFSQFYIYLFFVALNKAKLEVT